MTFASAFAKPIKICALFLFDKPIKCFALLFTFCFYVYFSRSFENRSIFVSLNLVASFQSLNLATAPIHLFAPFLIGQSNSLGFG